MIGQAHKFAAYSAIIALFLSGCAIGPKYQRPAVPTPPSYKELQNKTASGGEQWKVAQPSDAAIRGDWWKVFQDPALDALEDQANLSNQNIAAAAASFLAARAVIREGRSQYFPAVAANPSIVNSRPNQAQFGGLMAQGSSGAGLSVSSFTGYSLPLDASWEPDFWGRIRQSVRSDVFAAQASAADLENVRLSAQAELAADYYEVRAEDALKQLLNSTVAAYRESLDIAQSRNKAGLDSDETVAQAEAQLRATQAQDTLVGVLRAQYEHAIAVLVGQPASTFSLPVAVLKANLPAIPVGVPSEILERRPDIAAAERTVAQANAQIGVAKAAYFPDIVLSASGGLGNTSIADWFTWPSRLWAIGGSLTQSAFDAGLRRARVQQFQASYQETLANYRQTVLTAFQQVEDNLASLRILSQTIDQQDAAAQAAARSVREATVRYKAGIDTYLNVITAQTVLLNDQQTAINFRMQQMVASVQLIKALGGGWNAAQIPPPKEL